MKNPLRKILDDHMKRQARYTAAAVEAMLDARAEAQAEEQADALAQIFQTIGLYQEQAHTAPPVYCGPRKKVIWH